MTVHHHTVHLAPRLILPTCTCSLAHLRLTAHLSPDATEEEDDDQDDDDVGDDQDDDDVGGDDDEGGDDWRFTE